MKYIRFACLFIFSLASATEFTICSYNCGGLSEHYDYLRSACMQKLMQERYNAEPENMSLNEKAQQIALKILFAPDADVMKEWAQKYQTPITNLIRAPVERGSPNTVWNQRAEEMISSYKARPVLISDNEVKVSLKEHFKDLTGIEACDYSPLLEVRSLMAKRIFSHHLNYDIICLQEATYLYPALFKDNYELLLSDASHSLNGIAWNKDRFELVDSIGDLMGKAFAVKLRDRETGKTLLVASGHISGCNPYKNAEDAIKGDLELQTIVDLFDELDADIKLIGMDSNVTSLHPRLQIVKEAGYKVDYENYLEPTCTNPYQVLNTRIDWITVKAKTKVSIINIPVLSVNLNNIQTNISDHKPIAAKISY